MALLNKKLPVQRLIFAFFLIASNQLLAQKPIWKFKPHRTISFIENGRTTVINDTSNLPSNNNGNRTLDACPPNMDFENGDFTGWQCFTGASRVVAGDNSFVAIPATAVSPINGRHTVMSASSSPAVDQYGRFPVLCPNGSNYSIKLGNTSITAASGGGGLADKVRYTFTIPASQTNFSLIYYYAVVFNDLGHTPTQQPRFQAKIYNASSNQLISGCANYDFTAAANLPGFFDYTVNGNPQLVNGAPVRYKPWTPVTVNLAGYQGQTLILEFTRQNCTPAGHFGYAYIDVVPNCDGIVSIINGSNYCEGASSVTLTGPPGYQTYKWYNSSYSTLLGTGQTITLSPAPPNGTDLNIALFPYPGFGCDDTVTTTLTARPKPSATFTVDATPVCLSANAFSFTNTSTISDGSALTYKWLFGDNTNSTAQHATHTYLAAGTYSVQLVTFNNAGCSDTSAVQTLTVLPNPPVSFNITSAVNQCFVNNNYTVQNTSGAYGSPVTYTWYFDDGNSSNTSPTETHIYATAGTYHIKLLVIQSNNTACKDSVSQTIIVETKPTPAFDYYTGDNQCFRDNIFKFRNTSSSTGTLTYKWDFGDGTTSTQFEPQHSYATLGTYTVKLVASGGAGCIDSISHSVFVNANPVAAFTINDTTQCLRNNSFSFTDNSVYNGLLTWDWNFGDATTSAQQNPIKNYATYALNYPVQLIAITDKGCRDTITKKAYLFQHPVADFTVSSNIQQCEKNNLYQFTNGSTFPTALTYEWILGNGNISTQTNASAHYGIAGNYVVKLVATTTENGCTDTIPKTVEVYKNPGAVFTVNAASQCLAGNDFIFGGVPTGATYQYAWLFGDGGTSTSNAPSHTYATVSPFSVRLIVDNVINPLLTCSDTIVKTVATNPSPVGTITNKGSHFLCEGDSLKLTASGGVSYQWFKNGVAAAGATSASYYALKEAYYTVDAINQFNCRAASLDTVFIIERTLPKPDFAWDSHCIYKTVSFSNTTNPGNGNNASYLWDFGNSMPTSILTNPQSVYNFAGQYKVKLTATSTLCPSQVVSKEKIIQIELPPIGINYPAINAVVNNSYTLNARNIGAFFDWQPTIDLTNPQTSSPILKPTAERHYGVNIITPSGCQTTDSLFVRIFKKSEVLVPSAFTPNKDGLNDVLYAIPVGIREFKFFRVYNRWGNLVFSTTNEKSGWDGFYKGLLQPSDTYAWVAEGIDDNGILIRNGGNTILIR